MAFQEYTSPKIEISQFQFQFQDDKAFVLKHRPCGGNITRLQAVPGDITNSNNTLLEHFFRMNDQLKGSPFSLTVGLKGNKARLYLWVNSTNRDSSDIKFVQWNVDHPFWKELRLTLEDLDQHLAMKCTKISGIEISSQAALNALKFPAPLACTYKVLPLLQYQPMQVDPKAPEGYESNEYKGKFVTNY
jgi:hypothetical protein